MSDSRGSVPQGWERVELSDAELLLIDGGETYRGLKLAFCPDCSGGLSGSITEACIGDECWICGKLCRREEEK